MVNQRHCPFCGTAAKEKCSHLAMAAPARDFVQCCVDAARAQWQWKNLCAQARVQRHAMGSASADCEDFTWLETAFCDRFLRRLRWFGGMDHEWRTGRKLESGCFYVLLWSKSPQHLWWELLDNIDHQMHGMHVLPMAISPEPDLFTGLQNFRA